MICFVVDNSPPREGLRLSCHRRPTPSVKAYHCWVISEISFPGRVFNWVVVDIVSPERVYHLVVIDNYLPPSECTTEMLSTTHPPGRAHHWVVPDNTQPPRAQNSIILENSSPDMEPNGLTVGITCLVVLSLKWCALECVMYVRVKDPTVHINNVCIHGYTTSIDNKSKQFLYGGYKYIHIVLEHRL